MIAFVHPIRLKSSESLGASKFRGGEWGACRHDCCPQACHADYVNASSFHPGSVNVCFGDGSVRFVKDSIAMNIWWALGTRNGGEVISSDAY